VWCRDCNFKPVYTYGTPFHEKHLTCGEVLLTFTLYADTLLSINQIAPLLGRAYKTVHTAIPGGGSRDPSRLPVVWGLLDQTIDGPTQVDESGTVCSGYKGQSRRGTAVLAAARPNQDGHAGEGVTAIS